LLLAVTCGHHIEIVKFLLEKGANVNAKDKEGRTALYYAGMLEATEDVIQLLKDAGAKY
jgi:ankyrin repeat protein